ncbi:hypothetical protein FDUTEX481_03274 [Tolypothrix sp. PCC 7601]|nr:hypothetical protein FDUTEX481_03274 [Tolypothrix sp. PCC 7601]
MVVGVYLSFDCCLIAPVKSLDNTNDLFNITQTINSYLYLKTKLIGT